ncbi:heterokaryon incompatibility protein-domain-containing protein [Dactylonectria macrodidyma]|uniref:Heterokaryon incompatibility protein-domain-containing protein n=1 Tax=Dactylonectria macrodidyma TaxID=307937 RepID=A0A9P9FTJ8_9HYPO|nr:heterokaryon incompatibility protein-domain-containing protein [Dactylonectria macrodidyma]
MASSLCKRCESLKLSVAKFRINDKAGEENGTPTMPELTSAPSRSRRLRICWSDIRLKSYEAHIMLAAPPKYDKSDVDYPGLLNDETQFLGRRIGSSHNKKNLIREFLRLCETCHDHRCTGKLGIEDPFRETLNEPYFGVVDMENESLAPLPCSDDGNELRFEAYATVSYVWGSDRSRQHATRISNIQSRRKSGGLSAVIRQLPKALRQSINLVHGLGIRYIWIDALCIVQNSSHSWNLNARAMHLIYGNSTLTICAADGMDATTGLSALDDDHKPRQKIVNYAEGVCLMLHRPAETSIETTEWNKRAWTFQERLLSKRCLIFTEGKIFFQCRSTGMSEDVFSDRLGRGWSLDLVRAPLQMLSQLKVRALWFYAHCVALYTTRDLYEPFDILAAFSGMCKLMEQTMRAPFIFGLPTSHFDLALLWQPVGRASRLDRASASDDPKYKDMRFPSWSWCGWRNQGATFDSDMVGGCLADVRAWLLSHTWIDWHIRDGYGTLRRLWDARCAEEDGSEDDRWRGYKTVLSRPGADDDEDSEESAASDETSEDSQERRLFGKRRAKVMPTRQQSSTLQERKRANSMQSKSQDVQRLQRRLSFGLAKTDKFGRSYLGISTLPKVSPILPPDFKLTLPEDPYNVLTTETTQASTPSRLVEEFPDQPFLQFFTWRADFHVIRSIVQSSLDPMQLPDGPESSETEPLCRCEITDRRGDKCGSVVVDTEWLRKKESECQTMFEFIAISDAKEFTIKEFPDWTYYIPKERIESEWDLYFVLLVEFYQEEGIYRRVGLGKVFKAAFTHSKKEEWKEIILG